MKTRKRQAKKAQKSPVNIQSCIVREDLPMPFVHYPNLYGTFFVFSETEDGSVYLCSCAFPAVQNLLELKNLSSEGQYGNPLRMVPFDDFRFPPIIAKASEQFIERPMDAIKFQPSICHACNVATPSLRYCHEMYGGPFAQHYGWYIEQTCLRLGIWGFSRYLPDVCPTDLQRKIDKALAAQEGYRAEEFRLRRLAQEPRRPDIAPDEITYWPNVKLSETTKMITLRRAASRLTGDVHNQIENITREAFGFKKVGESGVSETILYRLVREALPGVQILRQHRPKWLQGLELDIYIPDLKLAIEYQGQQHFQPVIAWGGETALAELQKRDELKARLCKKANVSLLTFDYTEPFTVKHVRAMLTKAQPIHLNEVP